VVTALASQVYVWRGQECMADMLEAGMQAAARLSRYEGAPAAQAVRQGAAGRLWSRGALCG